MRGNYVAMVRPGGEIPRGTLVLTAGASYGCAGTCVITRLPNVEPPGRTQGWKSAWCVAIPSGRRATGREYFTMRGWCAHLRPAMDVPILVMSSTTDIMKRQLDDRKRSEPWEWICPDVVMLLGGRSDVQPLAKGPTPMLPMGMLWGALLAVPLLV